MTPVWVRIKSIVYITHTQYPSILASFVTKQIILIKIQTKTNSKMKKKKFKNIPSKKNTKEIYAHCSLLVILDHHGNQYWINLYSGCVFSLLFVSPSSRYSTCICVFYKEEVVSLLYTSSFRYFFVGTRKPNVPTSCWYLISMKSKQVGQCDKNLLTFSSLIYRFHPRWIRKCLVEMP